jgi:hypothetical protein
MRYAIVYGLLSGTIIIVVIIAGTTLAPSSPIFSSVWFGYLVMFVAMTFIFVGM